MKNLSTKSYFKLSRFWHERIKEYDIKHIKTIENKISGACCYIGKKDDFYIICFKGTELKLNDIITDLMFCKEIVPYNSTNKKIKVHKGFLNQYLSIRDELHKFIEKIIKKDTYITIKFTGHSLGGALSTLAILDINYNYCSKLVCTGRIFGSPKVGNKEFVKSFRKRVFYFDNYIKTNDFICKLPPFGYYHVGNVIKLKSKFNLRFIKNHLEYEDHLK